MKTLIGIISAIGALGYGTSLIGLVRVAQWRSPTLQLWSIGFAAGLVTWLALRHRLSFFSIFEHELTHLIFSILMFQRPHSFYASRFRGHVSCDRGNFIDGLAPYYFPTFAFVLIAIYPLVKPQAHPYFFPLLGFTTGYHVVTNISEFSPREADVRRYGLVFSLIFCSFAGIVTFGFLFMFAQGEFSAGLVFLKAGLQNIANYGHLAVAQLATFWS